MGLRVLWELKKASVAESQGIGQVCVAQMQSERQNAAGWNRQSHGSLKGRCNSVNLRQWKGMGRILSQEGL